MTYQPDTSCITPAVINEFQQHYVNLRTFTDKGTGTISLDTGSMSADDLENFKLDYGFKIQNPDLPLENLCSRIDNYVPRNDSQKEMLFYARQLINHDVGSGSAGLFMHGDTGVGKTHVAVGIAKELLRAGQKPCFIDAAKITYKSLEDCTDPYYNAWVLDDLNSPYGVGMSTFKKIVLHAHEKGGRVFVTSNTTYEALMKNGFGSDPLEKPRFMDRTKTMFKILQIHGSSVRQEGAWFADLQFTPGNDLEAELDKAIKAQNFELAAKLRDQINSDGSQ